MQSILYCFTDIESAVDLILFYGCRKCNRSYIVLWISKVQSILYCFTDIESAVDLILRYGCSKALFYIYILGQKRLSKQYSLRSDASEGGIWGSGFTLFITDPAILIHFNPQQLSSALSSACDFKKSFLQTAWTQIRIGIHSVCLYAKIGLKSLQVCSADDINRRHFQMQVFLAF